MSEYSKENMALENEPKIEKADGTAGSADVVVEAAKDTAEEAAKVTTDTVSIKPKKDPDKPDKKSRKADKKDKAAKAAKEKAADRPDLGKLKKKELLEIMLAQGEEIDRLRSQVADLEAQLADRNLKISEAGSIAEASLQLTNVFVEAEKAAAIYLENIRRQGHE